MSEDKIKKVEEKIDKKVEKDLEYQMKQIELDTRQTIMIEKLDEAIKNQ